jgi:hypothetical protein
VFGAESEQVEISQHDDGWTAECRVCHSWIRRHYASHREAENAFEQHLQDDYPHNLDEQSPPMP